MAEDLTLKELLGRAQTQSEQQAVEDLIQKLQTRSRTSGKALPAREAPPVGGAPQPSKERIGAEAIGPGAASQSPAEPPAQADAPASQVPMEAAARDELPSIDLEVYFEYGSAEIGPQALTVLSTLGRALADPRLAGGTFLIAGHTDSKGGAQFNLRLSQARAESVRRFLVQSFGLDEQRLVAKGYGARNLKNARDPRSADNRRVQVVNLSR